MLPEAMVWVAGVADKLKSATGGGEVATPANALVCGEPASSSLTLSVAEALPAVVGLKVMEMLHEAPAARVAPQLLEVVKDAALLPVRVMLEIVSAALPVLLSVADCAVLLVPATIEPKSSLAGVRVAAGAEGAVPVPVKALVCGEPVALSTTLSIAVAEPVAVGENVTDSVQEALAASDVPQVFDAIANCEALVPLRPMELMVRAAVPALARVKVCAALVLPLTALKLAVLGLSEA